MGPIVKEMSDPRRGTSGGSGRGVNPPRAPKTDHKRAEPSRKRVFEEQDRTEVRGGEQHREERQPRSRRISRSKEVSPSIVEPTQRQKEMLKESVDRQGWVRRRRQSKPAPRNETPDGAVGRELFPDDAEELESSQTEEVEEEPDVKIFGAKHVPKAPPPRIPEAPRSRQAVNRASPRARGSVREVLGPARPAVSQPRLAAAAAADVPRVRTPPRAPSRRSGDGSAACSAAGSQGVPSRQGMEPPRSRRSLRPP